MDFRKVCSVGVVIFAVSLSSIWTAISQQSGALAPGQKLALDFRSLMVRIDSDSQSGYGFVVAQNGEILTIVTADHVVRNQDDASLYKNLRVEFFVDRGHPVVPKVLEMRIPESDGDLAVLEVQSPNFSMIRAPVAKIPVAKGTKAWRIGKDGGWIPARDPGTYVGRVKTIWMNFLNLDTPPQSSGGPVITDEGLIGIVEKQEGQYSWVLPMTTVYEFFSDNALPWGLNGDGTAPLCDPDKARSVLAPLVDLNYGFSINIKCNNLDLNSFCQRAKRIFLDYKAEVDKANGQDIKDARLLSTVGGSILMTPLSSLWPVLLGGRPPIYFLTIDLFKTPADADRYMAGDLTISPNVSWVFAASNRELEHNLIFLKWTLADETLHADYLAQPLSTISDGVIASFQDLPGSVMLLFARDGQATDAIPKSLSIADKQGRTLIFRGTEFHAQRGLDRGTQVMFYKYTFP